MDSGNTRKVLAVDPALPYAFKGLPQGTSTIYVCAMDAYGARACEQKDLTVKAAPADFKVADALTSFDVSQLAGARDVSVMAAGAQALQSLSQFATDTADKQTEAEKAQVKSAVAAKTSAMISSLASSVSDFIDDPKTMSQVCVCVLYICAVRLAAFQLCYKFCACLTLLMVSFFLLV